MARATDFIRDLQTAAVRDNHADWGYWGDDPRKYLGWTSHSNRLIPVYTFGCTLQGFVGADSLYRDALRVERLYGRVPAGAVDAQANYCDQTDLYLLQRRLVAAGKKYVILFVFDGMDWQTTQAAAVYASGQVGYVEGRGTGLAFLDYRGTETDYGYCVVSPHNDGTKTDVDAQAVRNPGGQDPGGYDPHLGGFFPWSAASDPLYLIGRSRLRPDVYPDSAATATSLCAGIKTFNNAVNVDPQGAQVPTLAHELQAQGRAIGVVTSVPISHATPAAAYAHNVSRDDYQDLTRDLLGLPSVAHRTEPLPGVDVLLGAGWGETSPGDQAQGANYVSGNRYLTDEDLRQIDVEHGGRYVVAQRTAGASGSELLAAAAEAAVQRDARLFGFFGVRLGHLPFRTADGGFDPTVGVYRLAEVYQPADLTENPTLADLTRAALRVLETDPEGFWLMVEPGDVDWANHDDNLDNSIGAVLSGDAAFAAAVEWVAQRDAWAETAIIVTADHGHYFHLADPSALLGPAAE